MMKTRKALGTIIGSVMLKACFQKPAPSRSAYSYREIGMACSAARKMMMQNPRFFHRNSSTTGTRSSAPCSHRTRCPPHRLIRWFTGPP